MKGYIYLTKEYNSDGQELKHNELTKIGVGKSNDAERRFHEHHNKGSKSTTNMEFISHFECDDMDMVETKLHEKLKSVGFEVVKRKSQFGDITIESRTEVFSGRHIDTSEELSEKLILKILNSIVSGEEFIKITTKDFNPHFLQEISIRQILDAIDNESESDVNIIAELCARFGKTLTYLELFKRLEKDVMIIPSYMHSVFTSFENEILGKYKDESIGKWSNFTGFKVIDTREGDSWIQKYNENLGKSKLVVFVSIQSREESFSKFDVLKETDSTRKFILIDEADFGAHTENSQKVVDYVSGHGSLKIVTSGTGIDRAASSFKNKNVSDVVSISYTEMLLSKSGNSKYFNDEYLRDLDPVKNRRVVEYLTSVNKLDAMKSLEYAPGINFFKLVLPQSHRNSIHSLLSDEDLTGWSKILSDVNKNRVIIKSIIQGLFGKATIKDDILNTLSIHNAIEKEAKVVQFFVGTPTNNELKKLSEIFESCFPNKIVRVLSGAEDATNATSEAIVKGDIKKCKEENKDGVIILSKDMGSRSFSVSETDAVVLMYDNGSVSSLIQKISRALTGGLDYYDKEKKVGSVISLSLDPNRIDAVDIYVVEEGQKNKTKVESFLSAVKRIRRSVNIFAIDENGDRESLLERDEYYSELIDKFSFDKLKNSQINIIPLITDADLRSALLEMKSSELSKNDKKVKQLKGKGKKFLDSDNSNESDKKEEEFDKVDINLIRQAVLTINNSILSIIGIDDSIEDKSKSFRTVLNSIDSDVEKIKEFYELFGVRPSLVIKLMDKEVINEQIIDICISKF